MSGAAVGAVGLALVWGEGYLTVEATEPWVAAAVEGGVGYPTVAAGDCPARVRFAS